MVTFGFLLFKRYLLNFIDTLFISIGSRRQLALFKDTDIDTDIDTKCIV